MEKMASGESVDVIPSFPLQSVSFSESEAEAESRRGNEKKPRSQELGLKLKSESESESEQQQQEKCDQHQHQQEQEQDDEAVRGTSLQENETKDSEDEKRRKKRRGRSKLKRIVRRVSLVDTCLALFQVLYAQFRLLRPDHPMGRDVFGQFMDQSFIFPVILFLLIAFQGILAIRLYGATFLIEQVWALNENANVKDEEENDSEGQRQGKTDATVENIQSSPPAGIEVGIELTPSEQEDIIAACLKRCGWWFRGGIFFLILSFLDTFVIIFLLTFDAYKRLATIFLITTINLTQIIFRIVSLWLVNRFMKRIAISSYNSHPNLNLTTPSNAVSETETTKRRSIFNRK